MTSSKNISVIFLGSNKTNNLTILHLNSSKYESIIPIIELLQIKLKVIVIPIGGLKYLSDVNTSCYDRLSVDLGSSILIEDYFENTPKKKKHIKKSKNKSKHQSKKWNKNFKNDNRYNKITHKHNHR